MSKEKAPQRPPLAICWFRREDYGDAKAAMLDPERLYDTYDDWLREAQQFEKDMAAQGVKTERVRFDPLGFGVFCATRGMPMDGAARLQWAAYEIARRRA